MEKFEINEGNTDQFMPNKAGQAKIEASEKHKDALLKVIAGQYIPGGLDHVKAEIILRMEDPVEREWFRTRHALFTKKGSSMEVVRQKAEMLAEKPVNVLILGETGTGKEALARLLHGKRPTTSLVAINCAGIPDTLFESELFGHVKGAFTGAISDKPGRIEMAENGTVFLDEIGDLPMPQQAKLLRVIETGVYTAVGGIEEKIVHTRWVCATNRPLSKMRKATPPTFRDDLFWRISTVILRTVPLRERTDEIKELARYLCDRRHWTMPDEEVIDMLRCRIGDESFLEGNVRQLENYLAHWEYLGCAPEEYHD